MAMDRNYKRQWYLDNRERILADRKKHYAANRELIIARVAKSKRKKAQMKEKL